MRATFALRPAESKRLIAKAVVKKEEVQKALESAYIILCEGSTNVLVAQELFGLDWTAEYFTSGMSVGGTLCIAAKEVRGRFPLVAYKGELTETSYDEALKHFHLDTVIIKGGNAIDPEGLVGVIISGYDGGSVARVIGTATSQGNKIICPIGLEKAVFSVRNAARHTGAKRFDYSMGADYGMFILPNAEVVTEIQAIKLLTGAEAVHVASGGIGGSEGAVILSCEGTSTQIDQLIRLIEGIKGEPAMNGVRAKCEGCKYINCVYQGKKSANLPEWLGKK